MNGGRKITPVHMTGGGEHTLIFFVINVYLYRQQDKHCCYECKLASILHVSVDSSGHFDSPAVL